MESFFESTQFKSGDEKSLLAELCSLISEVFLVLLYKYEIWFIDKLWYVVHMWSLLLSQYLHMLIVLIAAMVKLTKQEDKMALIFITFFYM